MSEEKEPNIELHGEPEKSTRIKQRPVNMTGGDATIALYTNISAIVTTPFDLQVIFGEVTEIGEDKAEARALARIIMSPEHAALLLGALSNTLRQFVETHGTLRKVGVSIGGFPQADPSTEKTPEPT